MQALFSADQVRDLDARQIERFGVPGAALMEVAGAAVARAAARAAVEFGDRVLILAGAGNNGGDGYVAARWLQGWGVEVTLMAVANPRRLRGDARTAYRSWRAVGGGVEVVDPAAKNAGRTVAAAVRKADVVVDAVLGTGLASDVREPLARTLKTVARVAEEVGAFVVAVDVPSGVDASNGAILGTALRADATVTMGVDKVGLHVWPGAGLAGTVEVVDLGFAAGGAMQTPSAMKLTPYAAVAARPVDGHKGRFGTVVALSGSDAMPGAAALVARGALRAGAGKAVVAAPRPALARLDSEVVGRPTGEVWADVDAEAVAAALSDADAVVVGPGVGTEAARLADAACAATRVPIVLDADALVPELLRRPLGSHVVLTPHPGEAARMLGSTSAKVQARRLEAVQTLAERSGATVVLKGAGTLVADGERIAVAPWAAPGLAAPGSGDVLAGAIAAFAAQGFAAWEAACAGVALHGAAGASLPAGGNLAREIADRMAALAAELRGDG